MSDFLDDPETDRGRQPSHGADDHMSHVGNGRRDDAFDDNGYRGDYTDDGYGQGPATGAPEAPKPRVNAFGLPIQEPIQTNDLPPADALREFTQPLRRATVMPEARAPRPAPEPPQPKPPAQAEWPEPAQPEPPAQAEWPEPAQPEPPAQAEWPEPAQPEPPAPAEWPEPPQPVHAERPAPPPEPPQPEHVEQPAPPPPHEPHAHAEAVERFIADDLHDDDLQDDRPAVGPRDELDYDPFDYGAQDLDESPYLEERAEAPEEPEAVVADHELEGDEPAAQAEPKKARKWGFGLGRLLKRKSAPAADEAPADVAEVDEAPAPDLEDAYQARDPDAVEEDTDLAPDLAEDKFDADKFDADRFDEDLVPQPEAAKPLHSDDGKTVVHSGARAVPMRDVRSRTRSWDELEGADTIGADDLDAKGTGSYRDLDDDFDDGDETDISEPVYGGPRPAEAELEDDYSDDEHLQEDAEFPFPEERKKRRGAVVAAALVGAIALGGALAFAYKVVTGPGGDGSPPVIQADDSPTKVEPAQPGGRTFANQNKLIYDRLDGQGQDAVERVIPRSEEARDLPSPPAPASAGNDAGSLSDRVREAISTPKPEASARATDGTPNPRRVRTLVIRPDGSVVQQEESAPAEAAPSAPAGAPEPTAAAEPTAPAAEAPAKPQEETVAAAEPAAPVASEAASTGSGGFVVQLGARRSQTAALADFANHQQKYPNLLRGYKPLIQRADLGSRGVYYRLRVGPLESRGEANRLCTRLKSAGLRDCLVRAR